MATIFELKCVNCMKDRCFPTRTVNISEISAFIVLSGRFTHASKLVIFAKDKLKEDVYILFSTESASLFYLTF